jgi:starch phosphorylase
VYDEGCAGIRSGRDARGEADTGARTGAMDDAIGVNAEANHDPHRTGAGAELRDELVDSLIRSVGTHPSNATTAEWFQALALFTRGRMARSWLATKGMSRRRDVKTVYYLSLEFLIGRSLKSHLFNLGLEAAVRQALAELGVDLDAVAECEFDAALGNGGLGRLAACFLDSLATTGYPAYGYGIRYDHGMFAQRIVDGAQVEEPEDWLRHGNPWEYARPRLRYIIGFGGHVEHSGETARWVPAREVQAIAYDLQVSGFRQEMVNTIRLWSARAPRDVDLGHFNRGDHVGAVRARAETEALSRVLYPDDSAEKGRELRLRQEYFFVAASLADILGRYRETHDSFDDLPDQVAIQLNDTHPTLAVPELMRLLVDDHGVPWDHAWSLVARVFAYTNHTLLPEALETWPVKLLGRLLPRHLEIIYRINDDFLKSVASRFPGDHDLLRRVSIVDEAGGRRVRMAHLAFVGSHRVNGVSELHTAIMRKSTFADFERIFPQRIVCETNGITARRWVNLANPGLADLVGSRLGSDWPVALDRLEGLLANVEDPDFRERFQAAKTMNKARLAAYLSRSLGIEPDPASLFDVQIKRIHEYKRQLLNLMHVVARYNRIKDGSTDGLVPRTVVLGGKAASS